MTRFTDILLKHGNIDPDDISIIGGISVYPVDYFCPLNYYTGEFKINPNTRAIHHYCASWLDTESKIIFKINKNICSKGKIGKLFGNLLIIPIKIIRKIHTVGILSSVRYVIQKLFCKEK